MEPNNDNHQTSNDANQQPVEGPVVTEENPSVGPQPATTQPAGVQPATENQTSMSGPVEVVSPQQAVTPPIVPEAANSQPNVEQVNKGSSKKLALVLLGVAICLIAAFVIFKMASKQAKAPSENTITSKNSQSTQKTTAPLTVTEVAKHNSKDDCWTIISGQVYNLTDFVSGHPGGSEILRACGIDGTTLFAERETTDGQKVGSGTPHSSSASNQLETLLLGPVEQ